MYQIIDRREQSTNGHALISMQNDGVQSPLEAIMEPYESLQGTPDYRQGLKTPVNRVTNIGNPAGVAEIHRQNLCNPCRVAFSCLDIHRGVASLTPAYSLQVLRTCGAMLVCARI